jgi:hypothetical protein
MAYSSAIMPEWFIAREVRKTMVASRKELLAAAHRSNDAGDDADDQKQRS